MSEYIDILCHQAKNKPSFTVDTTGPLSVPIAAAGDSTLYAGEKKDFQTFDNFRILSAGLVLPENFCLAQVPGGEGSLNTGLLINIAGYDIGNMQAFSLPFSGSGAITLPMENYELPLDLFVDMKKLSASCSGPFNLLASVTVIDLGTYPMVSMVGVPAALNGTVQTVTLFLKILHNLEMTLTIPV